MDDPSDPTLSSVCLPTWPRKIAHYEILDKLGAGGMGVVYKARDTKLNRMVALKLLPAAVQTDPEARRRLLHEARAAAHLDHPNICSVFSVEEAQEGLCIVMQYLEGRSLKDAVADGPFPLDKFYGIALQLVAGLEEAHGKGTVHRDIKTANIMLLAGDKAKLVDFGLATSILPAEATMVAGHGGTPAYMAPELLGGAVADARSDLFSLGVVYYEMLTGRAPFPRDNTATMVEAILYRDPPPMEAARAGLPGELAKVVARLLVKDPGRRYASARELREDLEQLRAGQTPAAARAVHSPARVAGVVAAAAVILAVLVWAGVAFFGNQRPATAEVARVTQAGVPAQEPASSTPATAAKPSVAALPFTNAHKDPKWAQFEQGIADAFTDSFARDRRFRVVERSQLEKALEELKLNRSGAVDPATAQRVGKLIGARYLIVGSFQVFEGQMRLNARMIRVETGEIVEAQTLTGAVKDGLALPDRAAREFLKAVQQE